jgi:N-acetylmuramoyl-L-alanine amidase
MADDERLSRRSLLTLLGGGAGAALLGKPGRALAAALGDRGGEAATRAAASRGASGSEESALSSAPSSAVEATTPGPLPLAKPVLDAGGGQPAIIARRAWAGDDHPPVCAPEYGTVQMAFVHHTDSPNGYSPAEVPALLRSIYVYHRYGRGWNDIGYNFAIDRFGRIFEARAGGIDEPVIGAQAGGYNGFSTGIALLGDFEVVRVSAAARDALQRLIAWKLSLHGVPIDGELTVHCERGGAVYSRFPPSEAVKLDRVSGHRQADATTCPGNALYGQLQQVRRLASKLAGRPAVATLAIGDASAAVEADREGEEGEAGAKAPPAGEVRRVLSGKLAFLDGAAIAEAPIELQLRRVTEKGEAVEERTLATASTDANGRFSVEVLIAPDPSRPKSKKTKADRDVELPPEHITCLRALHAGSEVAPATISPPLAIAATISQVLGS